MWRWLQPSSISAQRIVSWLRAGADVCIALHLSLLHNYSSLWRSGKCSLRKKDKLSSLGWSRALDKWNKSGRNNYTSREPLSLSLKSSLLSNSGLNVATKIRDIYYLVIIPWGNLSLLKVLFWVIIGWMLQPESDILDVIALDLSEIETHLR